MNDPDRLDQFESIADASLPPTSDEPAEACPPGYLWLVYLYFRPRTFFRNFVIESAPLLTALCAWLYGVASAIDRIDMREAVGRPMRLIDNWPGHWGVLLAVGAWYGLLYFVIGGWFYRVRLRWSGAIDPDARLARRVFLYASQVAILPTIAVTISETAAYPTPAAVQAAEGNAWYFLLLIFPFWSAWTSYIGVRTAFEVRRGAAFFWYLIFPCLFYILAFAALLAPVAVQWAARSAAPDLTNPRAHRTPALTFSYPGNWRIDTAADDYDPNGNLFVEPPQNAIVRIVLYESEGTVADEMDVSLDSYRSQITNWTDGEPFGTWGSFTGAGATATGRIQGTPITLRVFTSPVEGSKYLEIHELNTDANAPKVRPGFELIRSTLRVNP